METEGIKVQYFKQQLEKGVRDILEAQRLIARSRMFHKGLDRIREQRRKGTFQKRSGALMTALTNPRYLVSTDSDGVRTETTVPTYIRFLDMKRNGNWQIYNRQVWGILYSETLQNIKYEYHDWIKKNFPSLLKQINNQSK